MPSLSSLSLIVQRKSLSLSAHPPPEVNNRSPDSLSSCSAARNLPFPRLFLPGNLQIFRKMPSIGGFEERKKKIAVVGAGASGLPSIKTAIEDGFEVGGYPPSLPLTIAQFLSWLNARIAPIKDG